MKTLTKRFPAIMMAFMMLLIGYSCAKEKPVDKPEPEKPEQPLVVEPLTSEGATIKLTEVDYTYFKWEVEPGVDCLSYRVDVFPYVRLQNDHFEAKKTDPGMTEAEFIKMSMFNQTGSGAGTFQGAEEYDTDMMIFQGFKYPDFEYVIVVYGCLNDDGTSPGEMTMLKVRTKAHDSIIGSPKVEQETAANYRLTQVKYIPNADCKYYAYLDVPKAHADEIIDEFGIDFLRDLVITFALEPSSEECEFTLDWGATADHNNIITSLVVAMDANYTRSSEMGIVEYSTLKRPDEAVPAEYDVTFTRASSYVIQFDVTMNEENTLAVFYAMKGAGYGYPSMTADILDREGWGVLKNDPHQWQFTEPDSEYELYATARNKWNEILPMETWPLGKTKPIGREKTGAEAAEMMQVSQVAKTKTSIKMEYNASTEAVASWFSIALIDGAELVDSDGNSLGADLTDPNNRQQLIDFMRKEASIIGNTGTDDVKYHTWTGMEPGQLYHDYVLAEDWNGDWAFYHNEMNTEANMGGENPAVTITGSAADGVFVATFTPNTDVTKMMYMIVDDELTGSGFTDKQMYDTWLELCVDYGLSNYGSKTTVDRNYTEDTSPMVALAVPFGKDNVRGELSVLKFDPYTGDISEWKPADTSNSPYNLKGFQGRSMRKQPVR